MSEIQKIKTAIQRTKKALTLKPVLGKGTGFSTTKITSGLACEIREAEWKINADMPAGVGGKGSAPTPGVYGRAALGACLAIGYMMKAAEMDIKVNNLEVEVQADFDDGALFGTADKNIKPGYLEVRYTVNIDSDEPEEKIMKLINEGDTRSPYLDIFTRAQKCIRKVNINPAKTLL